MPLRCVLTLHTPVVTGSQLQSGRPFDIRQLPEDMLEDFRRYNPDLNDAIEEALNRQSLPGSLYML